MIKIRQAIILLILLVAGISAQDKTLPTQLTPEYLFRVKPFLGKSARAIGFSPSGRYLAFLWNPIDETGFDLYIAPTASGKRERASSPEIMKRYTPPEVFQKYLDKAKQKKNEEEKLQKMYEAHRFFLEGKEVDLSIFEREEIDLLKREWAEKRRQEEEREKEEGEKKEDGAKGEKKEQEKEEWEWREELLKKKEKEKVKDGDLYPGVNHYIWSESADELIFEYRGDLFRFLPGGSRIIPLTLTEKKEAIVAYSADQNGYIYREGNSVFVARFHEPLVKQINMPLKDEEYKIERTSVSPDTRWMAIVAAKQDGKPAMRDVSYISYKQRFAEVKTTKRQVSDDKRNEPSYRMLIRRLMDGDAFATEPQPIFTIPGGDVWYELTQVVWSEKSDRYAFATWEREKKRLRVYVGKASETEKPLLVYENKGPVGHEVFDVIDPRFTPDGKTLVVILDEDGYRQPFAIDLLSGERRPLIRGEFESHPVIGCSRDSRFLYVVSNREDPAMTGVYKSEIGSGKLTLLGKAGGGIRSAEISKNSRWLAGMFGNWLQLPELFCFDLQNGRETIFTRSHDPDFKKVQVLVPQLFKFRNRHGDTLSGMVFKPEGWKSEDFRPAIVYMYGGPLGLRHTVEVDTFNTSTYLFNMYMAAKYGYVTFAVDPRGQSSYGRRFSDANWEQTGRPQVEDLEDLVKYISNGFGVDRQRIGLHGWSFGGFQTQMTMYSSPNTFACGIAGAGPTEWDNYNSWYSGRTIGESVRSKTTLKKYSLLPLAKNLKKPLLLMHGMEDTNVLYQDTIHIYKELLLQGKETLVELFVDPEGGHGLGGVVGTKSRFKKYEEFFLRHLGKGI